MKKFATLIFGALIAISANTASADLILSAIYDGSSSTPKGVELYVTSTGDYTGWTIDTESNSNVGFGVAYTFGADATSFTEGDFIYVTGNSTDACFTGLSNVFQDGSFNQNGDDRFRVTDGASVIDQYGVSGTDGTGSAWEYTDSFATRIDGTNASGGFVQADWNVRPVNTLDPGNDPLLAAKGSYVAVPEPSSLALLGLASLGLITRRRRS